MPVPSFAPGDRVPAEKLQLFGTEPEAHTPTLTATTNPTLGSGSSAAGLWVQQGWLIAYWFTIQFGTSGVNAGNGVYRVSLPVAADLGDLAAIASGSGRALDSSDGTASGMRILNPTIESANPSTLVLGCEGVGGLGRITHSGPWTWAANDQIWGHIVYPADL